MTDHLEESILTEYVNEEIPATDEQSQSPEVELTLTSPGSTEEPIKTDYCEWLRLVLLQLDSLEVKDGATLQSTIDAVKANGQVVGISFESNIFRIVYNHNVINTTNPDITVGKSFMAAAMMINGRSSTVLSDLHNDCVQLLFNANIPIIQVGYCDDDENIRVLYMNDENLKAVIKLWADKPLRSLINAISRLERHPLSTFVKSINPHNKETMLDTEDSWSMEESLDDADDPSDQNSHNCAEHSHSKQQLNENDIEFNTTLFEYIKGIKSFIDVAFEIYDDLIKHSYSKRSFNKSLDVVSYIYQLPGKRISNKHLCEVLFGMGYRVIDLANPTEATVANNKRSSMSNSELINNIKTIVTVNKIHLVDNVTGRHVYKSLLVRDSITGTFVVS